jgi:hypothetical protein
MFGASKRSYPREFPINHSGVMMPTISENFQKMKKIDIFFPKKIKSQLSLSRLNIF